MAKKNRIHPGIYFLVSAAFLSAGWLMRPFPLFIFVSLAPLFAITDASREKEQFWNLSELILAALTIGFLASHIFATTFLVISIIQAIVLTLAFLGYSFAFRRIGKWSGKFMVILFWLGLEYILVKLPWREHFVFLSDALGVLPNWTNWTRHSGYLGISCWILVVNLVFYEAAFRGSIKWPWVVSTVVLIGLPIGYSYWRGSQGINRANMIALYSHNITGLSPNYIRFGEVISSTAAGISALFFVIVYFSNQDRKK